MLPPGQVYKPLHLWIERESLSSGEAERNIAVKGDSREPWGHKRPEGWAHFAEDRSTILSVCASVSKEMLLRTVARHVDHLITKRLVHAESYGVEVMRVPHVEHALIF